MSTYSFIDLFAGAGGWSIGFEMAGFQHLRMLDHNESACRTAIFNFGDVVDCIDLSKPNYLKLPKADVIVGSPPCQGFSNEGKKNPDDPRNSLVWSFLDIIDAAQPKAWVFENVPGFMRSYGGRYFNEVSERLSHSGYKWNHFILNAADFGVPQYRKRFFIIAGQGFQPVPPLQTHAGRADLFQHSQHVSIWDAISDLPSPIMGDRVGSFKYSKPPLSKYQKSMREGSDQVTNHTAQKHSATVLNKISQVPAGGDMSSFIEGSDENTVHYCGGYRRATKHAPSWTAYWTRGMTSIHPVENRFLTPRECARIQSFPDKFQFQGSTIENYTQVCNAVSPLVAKAIAESLSQQLDYNKVRVVTSRSSRT